MKWLLSLFKRVNADAKPSFIKSKSMPNAFIQWRQDSFPMEVVGEGHYQDALISLFGRHTRYGTDCHVEASIQLEPNNPYDQNAVKVTIKGKKVGYLSRDDATRVGVQMMQDGLTSAQCNARVKGGWRTNQFDEGSYGVRLAIPNWGWIDFGIGKTPPETSPETSPWPIKDKVQRPAPSQTGPLIGARVALIGASGDSELAIQLAAAGARIMAGIGKTCTHLVVNADRPFDYGITRSATYSRALELIKEGRKIEIVSFSEIKAKCDGLRSQKMDGTGELVRRR